MSREPCQTCDDGRTLSPPDFTCPQCGFTDTDRAGIHATRQAMKQATEQKASDA